MIFNIRLLGGEPYCRIYSVLANTGVAIFRVNVYWWLLRSHREEGAGGEWDVKNVTARTQELAAIQTTVSIPQMISEQIRKE
jgi:hypothetical protein